MAYSVAREGSISDLISKSIGNVENSGKKTLIPTFAVNQHMQDLSSQVIDYARLVASNVRVHSEAQESHAKALERAILRYVLERHYPALQERAPLVTAPSDMSQILESKEPFSAVEQKDDFPYFKMVHLPKLSNIQDAIDDLDKEINLLEGARYVPSFQTADLLNQFRSRMSRNGLNAKARKRANQLTGVSLEGKESKELIDRVDTVMRRLHDQVSRTADNHSVLNLWELIALVDGDDKTISPLSEDETRFKPLLCDHNVHMAMAQSTYPILPMIKGSVILSTGPSMAGTDLPGNHGENHEGWTGTSANDEGDDAIVATVFDLMLNIAVRTAASMSVTINHVTLPLASHEMYEYMHQIFNAGQHLLIPEIESEFLDSWVKLAEMGSKSPVKTEDHKVRMKTAIHRDMNNIPLKFMKSLEDALGARVDEMIDKFSEKRNVYQPLIHAPIDRTTIRCMSSLEDIRTYSRVELSTEVPVIQYDRLTISKPASSDEAFVLRNRVDAGTATNTFPASAVSGVLQDLYRHNQPSRFSLGLDFTPTAFLKEMEYDHDYSTVPDLRSDGAKDMPLSNIMNGSFEYRDDVPLFQERQHSTPITMPRSQIRLTSEQVIHEFPRDAVMFGRVSGLFDGGFNGAWTNTVASLAARLMRVYATKGLGDVVKDPQLVAEYSSKKYLARTLEFKDMFRPIDVIDSPQVWRFLTSYHSQRMVRDKIDPSILDELRRADLYGNFAVMADVENYVNAIVASIKANFAEGSEGLTLFRRFVSGDLTELEMDRLRDASVSAVFNTILGMVFDRLEKRDTVLTLILLHLVTEKL